jgi:hypothetical protein
MATHTHGGTDAPECTTCRPSSEILTSVVARAEAEVRQAEERLTSALTELRASCQHPTILEAPWEASQSGWFEPLQAFRICETCGIEEVGPWFKVLTGRAYPASRWECYLHRKRGKIARVPLEKGGG